MATDIGGIEGAIELKDEFTSKIGLVKAALSNFSKENQESLKSLGEAAALVTAAFVAIGVAAVELGERGAEIHDLAENLDHFSGSSRNAEESMGALRKGVLGTVSDFALAKQATELLSAGVRLTAEDFGTLGAASVVLQRRGFGDMTSQLELVSRALITGRTRSLSMALGVIDAGNAEADYAKKIGITKDLLSDAGKAEAHRIEILNILRAAVADAGPLERNFGDQLAYAKTQAVNLSDETAHLVSQSPVLAAGMKAVFEAVSQAFGGSQTAAAESLVSVIEKTAMVAVNLGLAGVETARVFNVAWSLIKTTILGVETVLLAVGTGITVVAAKVLELAASAPGAGDGLKAMAASARDSAEVMKALTASVAAESLEASKGIVGHSEFDKTLDNLGGSLFQVKDAMEAASGAARGLTADEKAAADAANITAKNQKILAEASKKWQIDKDAADKLAIKTSQSLTALRAEDTKVLVMMSGTTRDAQIADVKAWEAAQIEANHAAGITSKEVYDEIAKTAHDKLAAVGVDWAFLEANSLEGLRALAQNQRDTLSEMQTGTRTFSRDVLQEQIEKTRDAEDAARGMGKAWKDAQEATRQASLARQKAIDEELVKTRELAKLNREMGASMEVTAANFAQFTAPKDISKTGLLNLLRQGFSVQNAIDILRAAARGQAVDISKWPEEARGPRVPGFAGGVQNFGGGLALVGERGPEIVDLPGGSSVIPHGIGSSVHYNAVFHVAGADEASVRRMGDLWMRWLRQQRMLPTS